MDNYLSEQQAQLNKTRFNLIKVIASALLLAGAVSAAAFVVPWLSWSAEGEQTTPDQWITSEIVFSEIKYISGKIGGSYYILDQNGTEYQSIVSEEKNTELQAQLLPGKTYTIKYIYERDGEVKRLCFLRDESQIYLDLKEGTQFIYKNKLIAVRVIILYLCFVLCAFIAMLIRKKNIIQNNYKKIRRHKKRIAYYKLNNEQLPEEPSLELACEQTLWELEKSGADIDFNPDTAGVMLFRYVQKAQYLYQSENLHKRALQFLLIGSFVFYACLTGLLTVNFQTEADWQNQHITFKEIGVEDYLPGLQYFCLYDQAGNCYKLPTTVEYKYLDLKKRLACGESYEIIYGSNKYLFRDQNYLYQLSSGSVTYIALEEARESLSNYFVHVRALLFLCPLIAVLIIVAVSKGMRSRLYIAQRVLVVLEGLLCFYEHTELLIPEMYPDSDSVQSKSQSTHTNGGIQMSDNQTKDYQTQNEQQESLGYDPSQPVSRSNPERSGFRGQWLPPKNISNYFSSHADDAFKQQHPKGYYLFGLLLLTALFLPALLFIQLMELRYGITSGGTLWLGIGGSFIMGLGFSNLVGVIVKQYFGHLVTLSCLIIGITMVVASLLKVV